MTRVSNEAMRKAKYELILEKARLVFCRKGYAGVTMKDIIEECEISRGGIYLYFSSIEEIFKDVVLSRERRKFEGIRDSVHQNVDFLELLDAYFLTQKKRLLNMSESLLRAMYEYHFTHKSEADFDFREAQVDNIRNTLEEMLSLGVKQNYVVNPNIDALRDHMMFMIEGLSVYSLLGGLTEANVDEQFKQLRAMILAKDVSYENKL